MRRPPRAAILALPGLALIALLFVVPMAVIIEAAMFEDGVSLAYVDRFFASGAYLAVFVRTIEVSTLVALICLFAGYPAALFIARQPARRRTFLVFLVFVPMWMSILIRTYSWLVVLGREGIINTALMHLGIIAAPLKMIYTTGAVYLTMVQVLLPIMVMTCLAAMTEIDDIFMRAARILGARPREAFLRVFLPLSLEGAVSGFVLVFILGMGFFVVPALVGGPRDAMMGNLISTQVEQTNWGFAAALAMVLLVATLAAMLVIRLASRRFVYSPAQDLAR